MKSSTLILVGVAVVAALYGGKIIRALAPANAAGVTTTKKEGVFGGSLNTTPINTSAVAWVSRSGTASAGQGTANNGGPSSSFAQSKLDAFQPFGNVRSAEAAYTSPIRPQYAPSAWADLKVRG